MTPPPPGYPAWPPYSQPEPLPKRTGWIVTVTVLAVALTGSLVVTAILAVGWARTRSDLDTEEREHNALRTDFKDVNRDLTAGEQLDYLAVQAQRTTSGEVGKLIDFTAENLSEERRLAQGRVTPRFARRYDRMIELTQRRTGPAARLHLSIEDVGVVTVTEKRAFTISTAHAQMTTNDGTRREGYMTIRAWLKSRDGRWLVDGIEVYVLAGTWRPKGL